MADEEQEREVSAGQAEYNEDENDPSQNVARMLYYEACMRNHAAAFANAAAGAAYAAAHAAAAYHTHANNLAMSPSIPSGPMYPPPHFFPSMPYPPIAVPQPFFAPGIPTEIPSMPPSQSAQHHTLSDYRLKRERTRFSGRRRVRSDNDSSSSGGGNSWRRPVKKKVTALIGKTGVSVLFEWASKRQITPTLTLHHDSNSFECIVYLPDDDDKGIVHLT